MPDLGPHTENNIWAYAGVALGVVLLFVFVILDARRTAARLRQLEARGIRRRSAKQTA